MLAPGDDEELKLDAQIARAREASHPQVTVVIPTLNEAQNICRVLRELDQENVVELLVVDGGSSDGTQSIVRTIADGDPRVRLIHNPDRRQSAGVNLGESIADPGSGVIVRADAHAHYPRDFVRSCIDALDRNGADSVVVRLRSTGGSCLQRAVAYVSNSFIGAGGSVHRQGGKSGWVEHGHHAAFRREAFSSVGGYDPSFRANEDAELDHRLRKASRRIWFQSEIEIGYLPRRTLVGLARQYLVYGGERARNFLKHRSLRLRQMAAPALVLCVAASLLLSIAWPPALLAPLFYACVVMGFTLHLALTHGSVCALMGAAVIPTMHFSWGAGFLARLMLKSPSVFAPGESAGSAAVARYAQLDSADVKVNMTLSEAVALSEELAARTASFGRPDIVVGIANGALLPAKVVADRLGARLHMVKVRRQGSRLIATLGAMKRALAIPSFIAHWASLRKLFYWYQTRYTKLEASAASFEFDVREKTIALIDDCIVSGESVGYVRRRLLDCGAANVTVHVICWSVNSTSAVAPQTHLHRRVHFYPWSHSSPFYRSYQAWLKASALEAW